MSKPWKYIPKKNKINSWNFIGLKRNITFNDFQFDFGLEKVVKTLLMEYDFPV